MQDILQKWLYPNNLQEAEKIQKHLSEQIILQDDFASLKWVGGMDVSNNLFDSQSKIYASTVVLNYHTLQLEEEASISELQLFPYIPGFLGFREAPALVEAFKKLKRKPDILLVDGHGISHPRGLGIASHIGVLLDIPTIGVAKSVLIGNQLASLKENKGEITSLIWKEKEIGVFLRTKLRCNPLIISSGHRVSLKTAVKIVLQCITRYKLPEPTRQAHLAANRHRRSSVCSDKKFGIK